MMACECGVPRLMKSASAFLSSISTRAFSAGALHVEAVVHAQHLDLLAVDAALGVDRVDHQLRAADVSFTVAATEPVMPAVWPIRSWADAPMAARASRAAAQSVRVLVVMETFRGAVP